MSWRWRRSCGDGAGEANHLISEYATARAKRLARGLHPAAELPTTSLRYWLIRGVRDKANAPLLPRPPGTGCGPVWQESLDEFRSIHPPDHRICAPASGLGGADRVRAVLCRVAGIHLAPDPGLGRAGGPGRLDQRQRFELLADLVAGSLGAALGDWLSYWIGLKLENRVYHMWPLSQQPDLIPDGEAFVQKWGALAIFIGRFSGRCAPRCRWSPAFSRCRTGVFRSPISPRRSCGPGCC